MKLRCVWTAPFGLPVVPDVYMIAASASGSTSSAGSGGSSPSTTAVHGTPPGQLARRYGSSTVARTLVSPRCGATRSARSSSANSTTDPESASPYASSGPVHHALSGTATAPIACAAQNAMTHSGTLRVAIATRSPGCDAVHAQPLRDRAHVAMRVRVGDPLVAVDEVVVAGERRAQVPDRAQRRRRVAEHLRRHAADVDDVDREEVAQVGCIGHGAKLSVCSVSGTLAGVTASGRRPGKAAIMRAAVEVIAEDGYEGASTRDMAARAGVSVAALYHHFPSKLGLLREFLDEAYDGDAGADRAPPRRRRRCRGPAGERRRHAHVDQRARRVRRAAPPSWPCASTRASTRPTAPPIEVQRKALLDLIEGIVRDGIRSKAFRTDEPREVARAVVSLTSSLVGVYAEIDRPLDDVIALYQRFAVNLAGASGSRRRA